LRGNTIPRRAKVHRAHPPAKDGRVSAAKRGYGRRWAKLRLLFLRSNPLCAECQAQGRIASACQVDHVLAREKGGTDDEGNLRALCHSCHSKKTYREDSPGFGYKGKT
jgi:5-methylcytosine-specific restriction protein A